MNKSEQYRNFCIYLANLHCEKERCVVTILVTIEGVGLVIGFILLCDTARDYTLQFTVTHTSVQNHFSTNRYSVAATNGGHSP
jgi:hypothetical protein